MGLVLQRASLGTNMMTDFQLIFAPALPLLQYFAAEIAMGTSPSPSSSSSAAFSSSPRLLSPFAESVFPSNFLLHSPLPSFFIEGIAPRHQAGWSALSWVSWESLLSPTWLASLSSINSVCLLLLLPLHNVIDVVESILLRLLSNTVDRQCFNHDCGQCFNYDCARQCLARESNHPPQDTCDKNNKTSKNFYSTSSSSSYYFFFFSFSFSFSLSFFFSSLAISLCTCFMSFASSSSISK